MTLPVSLTHTSKRGLPEDWLHVEENDVVLKDALNTHGNYIQTTAPSSPATGWLWTDTSTTPPTPKVYDGAAWQVVGGSEDYINIRDEKASGTEGGGFTSGAWQTRVLNTESSDAGGHASIASNQITLAAGTYRAKISAPAYSVQNHQARLRQVSGTAATLLVGTSEYADTTNVVQTRSFVEGRFTLAAQQTLEVQHVCSATKTVNGFGVGNSLGEVQVYTVAELWREP